MSGFAELHPPFTPQAAVVEANRCLYCYDAPCTGACPTHIDVPRFIKQIAGANLNGAAQTILASNVLGLSCSRVCPVDVLCEGACVMHNLNKKPIEIGRLQRRAMDHFYESGGRLPQGAPSGKKVACIGAGPASLACAAELRRNGCAVTIFDKKPLAGGLNTYGVAQYKFTPEDSRKEVELLRAAGVEFRNGAEIGGNVNLNDRDFDAVFIGVGLGPTQPLGVPGENMPGVHNAIDFIAAYKTATPLPMGSRVVVIGGGNTAIDAAVAARRLGAADVTMIYRRTEADMSAFAFEYQHARHEGVQFRFQARPSAITGNGKVEAVECGADLRLPCDTVIVSIGQSKAVEAIAAANGIALEKGRVVAKPETGQTSNPKYFAGGDCVNGGREVVDAVAEGKRAAKGILAWLT
ncbi:MAG: NAD(P)-dependent oxidoreductase [Candidatus Solibacter usitatus]|nr:NAD(P)-dependent oxidoreductase [Candidatus Solibacter usitatus]